MHALVLLVLTLCVAGRMAFEDLHQTGIFDQIEVQSLQLTSPERNDLSQKLSPLKDSMMEQSVQQTFEPTMEPTIEPTIAPTLAPVISVSPTRSPSAAPTAAPTAVPSVQPSPAPSRSPTASPSFRPTRIPTATPTPRPTVLGATNAPTAAPSYQVTPAVTVTATLQLSGFASTTLSDDEEEAVRLSTASAAGVDSSAVEIKSVSVVSRRQLSSSAAASQSVSTQAYTLSIDTAIRVLLVDFLSTGNVTSAASLGTLLASRLETSVSSGSFVSLMQAAAEDLGLDSSTSSLFAVAVQAVVSYAVEAPAPIPSSGDDDKEDHLDLILGLTLGLGLGLIILIGVAAYFYFSSAGEASVVKASVPVKESQVVPVDPGA